MKPLLFHNDETYPLVLFENVKDRVKKQAEWKRKNKGMALPSWSKDKENDPGMKGLHKAKYSKQDGGKQSLGNFSVEGIKRYNGLTEDYIKAKFVDPAKAKKGEDLTMKPEWVAWEEDYLQRMRAHFNIPDVVPGGKGKGKKREKPAEPVELPMDLDE